MVARIWACGEDKGKLGVIELFWSFLGGSDGKESTCNAGDWDLIPGLERSEEENGNPLQYSCLENPMDRGAWQGLTKSWTQLSN